MPPENTDPVPMTPHKKSRLWMILAILAALLSIGLGVALWYALAQKQPVTPNAFDLPTQATTESLNASFGLASTTHKPGTLIDQFSFSMTAPTAWRTVDTSRDINNPASDPMIESENQMLLELTMVPEDRKGTANEILGTNILMLRDISPWAKASNSESTSGQRQKALDYIMSLGSSSEPKQMTGETNGLLDINRGLIGGPFLRAKGVTTKDGSLKGVVYLTIGTQALDYTPKAMVVMAGTLNGKQVLLTGTYDIVDALLRGPALDESSAAKAQDAFKNNQIPEDTANFYQHIVDAVGTIEIKKK